MKSKTNDNRLLWLTLGLLAGMVISYVWPHEPAFAGTADRNDKFAMITTVVQEGLDAVFVLDFLTGRLTGAALNRQGDQFVLSYYRNVASDFQVNPDATPQYAIVSGDSARQNRSRALQAPSSLYVAELTSGRVGCYAIPFIQSNRPVAQPIQLEPVGNFPFREAIAAQ